MIAAFLGQAVGDALGVPVEFHSRACLRERPVTGMMGYGSHHQPPGTWSDDASLTFCSAESLLKGFDLEDMGRLFVRWLDEGYWGAHGHIFDVGRATSRAICRLRRGISATQSGEKGENSNGNGALMRILPVAAYFAGRPGSEMLDAVHKASAITHAHPRSMIACGLYGLLVRGLMSGLSFSHAYAQACAEGRTFYIQEEDFVTWAKPEIGHFDRFLSGSLVSEPENSIRSGGYVVDSLEASAWCLLTTGDFASAVLRAVNLGDDTDTTGAITGGLAGLYYKVAAIPQEWLDILIKRVEIEDLARRFVGAVSR